MISKKFLGIFGILVLLFSTINFFPSVDSAGCQCMPIAGGEQLCIPDQDTCPSGTIAQGNCGTYNNPLNPFCSGSCDCIATCIPTCTVLGQTRCSGNNIETCTMSGGCLKWVSASCGTSVCQPDVCSGPIYSDYPSTCTKTCSSGACVACTCTPTSTQTCDASKSCETATCNGAPITCHYSGGVWRWDSSAPECVPTSYKLIFRQGAGPNNAAVIGSNGALSIRGTLATGVGSFPASGNDFVVKNGANVVAMIDRDSGNLYLQGQIFQGQPQATLTTQANDASSRDFIVKSSTGNAVAVFKQNGNLYLLGGLKRNTIP